VTRLPLEGAIWARHEVNNGDGYEIYKVLAALDQPGRGKGDLLADQNPAATGSWPHQALEPVYAWGNMCNNSRLLDVGSHYPSIRENRDYYNQKNPFDGTAVWELGRWLAGLILAPWVAYWATDQGSGTARMRSRRPTLRLHRAETLGHFIISPTRIHILW